MRTTIKTFIVIFSLVLTTGFVSAQIAQKQYNATVKSINEYEAVVEISNGDRKGEQVTVVMEQTIANSVAQYKVGDKVFMLAVYDDMTGTETFYITDHDRSGSLALLAVLFVLVVLVVSKKWGILSLVGMAYSFFIIFKYILPALLKGYNPLFVAITGTAIIAPVTFYLSHGLNRKTTVALFSTLLTLSLTGILASVFISLTKLTGFGSDDAFFLQVMQNGAINMRGIFLAGVIIGTLGILDDVTISQAAIVAQLKHSVPNISDWDLYKKSMEIGHDHIASTVNTLVLVYTGAALPLLLLFLTSSKSFGEAINAEIIAGEIVRTLVGSVGLVLAVPISTILAVFFTVPEQSNHKH